MEVKVSSVQYILIHNLDCVLNFSSLNDWAWNYNTIEYISQHNIYHANVHEAVTAALQTWGAIPDKLITCCTSQLQMSLPPWNGACCSVMDIRQHFGHDLTDGDKHSDLTKGMLQNTSVLRAYFQVLLTANWVHSFLLHSPSRSGQNHSPCESAQQMPINMSDRLKDILLNYWWNIERLEKGRLSPCQRLS